MRSNHRRLAPVNRERRHDRADLKRIARAAMVEKGLEPDFSRDVLSELDRIHGAAAPAGPGIRDLRDRLWVSIDNDDSRDLDQLTVAEPLAGGAVKIFVAVADVDALVVKGSAIDAHAQTNTTSVYTAAEIFPMLPEKLSTDLTSLNEGEDRLAVVVEMTLAKDGALESLRRLPRGRPQQGQARLRQRVAWVSRAARSRRRRSRSRACPISSRSRTASPRPCGCAATSRARSTSRRSSRAPSSPTTPSWTSSVQEKNRARQLIEDFMIAANGVTARFLAAKKFAALRRVVRSPERWQKIVAVAAEYRERLPAEPDAQALEAFLLKQMKSDPLRFPDLSLVIVKLMGAGEYVVERPGETPIGHFGLAVRDYTHSTAPNRRYPDLLTQRLLKAAMAGEPTPYPAAELGPLAAHCTEQEDDANKVERLVRKAAAALLLEQRIGQLFDGVVTGASEKGTWVRIFAPPAEGKLVHGFDGVEVGDKLRVKLDLDGCRPRVHRLRPGREVGSYLRPSTT